MNDTKHHTSRKLVQEPFHDEALFNEVWGQVWGVSTDIGQLKKVLMHRPGKEILKLNKNPKEIEAGPLFGDNIKGTQPETLKRTLNQIYKSSKLNMTN